MHTTNGQMQYCNIWKEIEYQCNFFIVPGNRPAILEMPDFELLKLLTVNCQTVGDQHKWQINQPTKNDKSKPK